MNHDTLLNKIPDRIVRFSTLVIEEDLILDCYHLDYEVIKLSGNILRWLVVARRAHRTRREP